MITHIEADYANKKDSQSLPQIIDKLKGRLTGQGLIWRNLLADTGYSSGVNYAFLEEIDLKSYIPPHGTYGGRPKGFTFDKENNRWVCPEGKSIHYRKTHTQKDGIKKNYYRAKRKDCKACPMREQCLGKGQEKVISITYYHDEYQRAIARVQSKRGKRFKKQRSSTVEPVFGTLTQFMGLRKINTRGIRNANKVMLMSAIAYNLKKYLKYTRNRVETGVGQVVKPTHMLFASIRLIFEPLPDR